jgi:hypothetical protein
MFLSIVMETDTHLYVLHSLLKDSRSTANLWCSLRDARHKKISLQLSSCECLQSHAYTTVYEDEKTCGMLTWCIGEKSNF